MSHDLSTRLLTARQIITLDRLGAYDASAKVVGWIFFGPLVRLKGDRYVYILPDGWPMRVPRTLLFPE
jgi:hypothetical protein